MSPEGESDPRPSTYQVDVLPLNYLGTIDILPYFEVQTSDKWDTIILQAISYQTDELSDREAVGKRV